MKCKNCGSSDFEETWIDYPAKIYDEIEYIETEGFECLNCGEQVLDRRSEVGLLRKIDSLKIKHYIENKDKFVPIIVSSLKKIRMGKEISQKLVGQALGITEQRFGSIEQPLNTPTLKTVLQIADVLGVTADDLYKIKHLEKEEYKRLRVLRHTVNGFEEVEGLSELYVIYDKLTIDLNNCHDKSEKKEINIKIKKALADIREVSKLNKCILKREHHIDVENYELWLKYNN